MKTRLGPLAALHAADYHVQRPGDVYVHYQ
jgi:hypothetical protein